MTTGYFTAAHRWVIILSVMMSLIAPKILFAKIDTIYVAASSKNTGTVFSDGTFLQTSLIRIGQTSDYNGKVSGGWVRFNVSTISDGSKIDSIKNTVIILFQSSKGLSRPTEVFGRL